MWRWGVGVARWIANCKVSRYCRMPRRSPCSNWTARTSWPRNPSATQRSRSRLLSLLKIYAMADATSQCFLISKPSNDEILKRQSDATENRDLIGFRAARMHTSDDLTKFRIDNLCADARTARRSHCDREITVITNKQRGPEKIGAHFGLAGLIGSQRRYMGSQTDHIGMEERRGGPGSGDDNIGIADRCIEIVSRLNLDTKPGVVSGRELPCPTSRNIIDACPSDRTDKQ